MTQTPTILRKIVTPLILTSFLTVAFFGLASMSRGADGNMQGDCPFSTTGAALCPQDALPGAIHHLSAFEAFFSVPVGTMITALISALLLVAFLVLIPAIRWSLLEPPIRRGYVHNTPQVSTRLRKITRWLSLLENSPSFA